MITVANDDRDLDRCRMIADLCRALDLAAGLIETAADVMAGDTNPDALIPVRAAAAQARTIANNARDSIA